MNADESIPMNAENRPERLQKQYEILVQLLMNETTLMSDRTSNYLLFNSILFATVAILPSQSAWIGTLKILKIAFPVVGLMMSVFQSIIIAQTMKAATFWRSTVGLIERDPDFCVGKKESDADLNIFLTKEKYDEKKKTKQGEALVKRGEIPKLTQKLLVYLPHTSRVYVAWLPFLVGALWSLALIWILTG